MSLTIDLQSIKCLDEVNEASASEEPYVLITSANLRPTLGPVALPRFQVFRYGVWEDFDEGEVKGNSGPAFWGVDSTPEDVQSSGDVALIVSLMENDNGDPGQYRTFVNAAVAASLTSTLGETDQELRAQRLLTDVEGALDGVNFPFPFTLDDDHVGSVRLTLDADDLIPFGTKEKKLTISNDEGSYELTFRIHSESWAHFELSGPGSASANGGVAAVSRIPSSMELWWAGSNGSVEGAYWYDGFQWQRYQIAAPGSAATDAGITVASRIPNSMELWWVGPNGSVEGAYWYEGNSWQRYQIAGPGSAATSGGISVVSRVPNSMELWWVGPNGSIEGAYWYDGFQWQRYQIAGPGSAATNSGIAAVSRIPNSMELWWVGGNGALRDAFWYDGQQWQQFDITQPEMASRNGGVAAVSRIPNSMELWWVGGNGSVGDAYWYE